MAIRRNRQFLSLNEEDEESKSTATISSSEFIVCYMGSTAWTEDFTSVEDLLVNVMPSRLSEKFRIKKSSKIKVKLFVDVSGDVVHMDYEGTPMEHFKLCNIKEVIYGGHTKRYSKFFILVGCGESDENVKAHIMVCDNVKVAKHLYKTFTDVFTDRGKTITRKLRANENSVEATEDQDNPYVLTDSHNASVNRWYTIGTHSKNSHSEMKGQLPSILGASTESDFTKIPRSRSVSSYPVTSF